MGRYGLDRWDVDSLAFHAPVAMHDNATIHGEAAV
jgi:hypothetical protein